MPGADRLFDEIVDIFVGFPPFPALLQSRVDDSELCHLVTERPLTHSEKQSRAGLNPSRFLESGEDALLFPVIQIEDSRRGSRRFPGFRIPGVRIHPAGLLPHIAGATGW